MRNFGLVDLAEIFSPILGSAPAEALCSLFRRSVVPTRAVDSDSGPLDTAARCLFGQRLPQIII